MSENAMNLQNKIGFHSRVSNIKQRGVVLFIALIALVVMSLAAVALIRSVDTATIIAGNLANKQSATISADNGLETAVIWLASKAPAVLNSDQAALGYYATQNANPMTFAWDATDSRAADDVSGIIDADGKDASGNTIRYVIQRMCRNAGAPVTGSTNCLFGPPGENPDSNSIGGIPDYCKPACPEPKQSPVYRVTARVVGVKNTISYIQAFIF